MKIHEYQGKELLRKYGVAVPRGIVARSPEEAYHAAKELGTEVVVVKAQIHAGGRGKGGGVKLAKSADQAREIARQMLGMNLKTHQTGPEGQEVRTLLVEEGLPIDKEFYLGIVLDRQTGRPVFMASSAGGMDIEEVAAETPEKILKETIDPAIGFRPYQARKLAFGLGLPAELINQAAKFMQTLYTAYEGMDASLLEINPFLLTKDKRLIALDAKVNFDDNAMFRHQDFLALRDLHEEEPLEIEASKYDLNYIKLDGNIACMVNGAGLAMATMDIIKLAGGEPANFLDVGGGASQERVEAAFRILLADPHVQAVLINIFGGIVRCDMVARGVVGAAQSIGVKVPVVVRLEGTNVEEGQRVIRESGLNFTVANGMKDAAEKVVALADKQAA
ncbi:MAG: ADP-forming succinate--CoA ligase subunit beta [Pyrinomonadaceae bacterium]|nr:ADP-forming succinate--CoA ligase subunit beta [Pyrinomonadaceae bacterium]MDQ3586508.1 ADP-forming succinate--CoA ligase subunit beta [Acidobacteriota bacterium]